MRKGSIWAGTGAGERGQQTPCTGRFAARIGAQLQRRDIDHSPRDPCRMSGDHGSYGASTPVIAKAAQPQSRHQWSASSVDNPVARPAHGRVP